MTLELPFETTRFEYVGPPEIREGVAGEKGVHIENVSDLENFLAERQPSELDEPFTYVVNESGLLLLAPRRSEHVECSGGSPVLAAGEIGFSRDADDRRWEARYVSNQSNGYCPDVESWVVVARVLDLAGIVHGMGFTHPINFRKCSYCGNWNLVKEEVFVCALCDRELSVEVDNRRL
ncbi:hypothetical protein [Streptomyces sp. WAC 04229]|uniref:hypothetical protein n=1 Tax=Streptomyces sp. WAC 04229 TaxID=2203206 RepID=UPI003D70E07D